MANLRRELENFLFGVKEVKAVVRALLKTYRHLEERIGETNALVNELDETMPSAQLVQTVPGFGQFLSVLVAVEIADIGRFEDVGKFHAYAGVIPSTHQKQAEFPESRISPGNDRPGTRLSASSGQQKSTI